MSEGGLPLKISILKCRNLPPASSTVVSYSYILDVSSSQSDEDEKPVLNGSTDPFENAPEGTINEYNFQNEHILPPITESILQQFITSHLQFSIEIGRAHV